MTAEIADEAYQFMRAHLHGKIRFGEDRVEIRVAPTPSGHLVASVMVSMLRSVDTVLELPDDSDDALVLQVTLEQIDERGPDGAMCDRWCIYHGEPPDVRWARMQIDAARYKGYFIDGQALMRENPFASQEGALCKELNSSCQEQVIRAARASGEHLLIDPKVVGVDPWGIDARAQLGIARIPAIPAIDSPSGVRPWLAARANG
jgi:hypothetical protein